MRVKEKKVWKKLPPVNDKDLAIEFQKQIFQFCMT